MSQVVAKHFEADGAAVNIDLGFVPSYVEVINMNAATDELVKIQKFAEMGSAAAVELWTYSSNAAGAVISPLPKVTGGYIAAYDTTNIGNRQSVVFDYTGGASDDLFTVSAGHGYIEGEKVRLVESGGLGTGLAEDTTYYVKYLSPTTFQVSLTSGGTAVAFTSDGTIPNYVFSLDNLKTSGGFQGITIAAGFMGDGDEVYVYAVLADIDKDDGDING